MTSDKDFKRLVRTRAKRTGESWGIRRFSLLDPSGNRVTVLAHTKTTGG